VLAWQRRVARHHALMDDDSATDGFDRAIEHRQEAVTRIIDKLAVVLCESRLDEFAPLPHHACVGSFLIELHKAAISRDISREDCRNPSQGSFRRWGTIFATAYRMNLTARSVGVAHWERTFSDDLRPGAGECVRLNVMTSVKSRLFTSVSSGLATVNSFPCY
jgi:hypothetical protein